jgi:hypothetical protein
MFRFIKVIVALVVVVVAGAFLYDKYRVMCCDCDGEKCC